MKKVLSFLFALALFATLLFTQQAAVAADTTGLGTSSDNNELSSALPDRSSWQLTSAELNAPTEELIKSILASPYILELTCSSGPDHDVYGALLTNFNGLSELESRSDAASVMLSLFDNIVNSDTKNDNLGDLYLELLLSRSVYFNQLSPKEKEIFAQLVAVNNARNKV